MKITVTDAKTQPFQERMGRKIQVLFDDATPDASQIQLMTVEYPSARGRLRESQPRVEPDNLRFGRRTYD